MGNAGHILYNPGARNGIDEWNIFSFCLSPLHAAKAITTTTYVYHSNQIKSNETRSDQLVHTIHT